MGGRATEDVEVALGVDTVKDAQAAWQRLPPVAGDEAREFELRFQELCRRVLDHARRHSSSGGRRAPHPTAQAV